MEISMEATKLKLIKKIAPDLTEEFTKRFCVLKAISVFQPCGRRAIVDELNLTERAVRSIVELLNLQGLIIISKNGMNITGKGMEMLEELNSLFLELTEVTNKEEKIRNILNVKKVFIAEGDSESSLVSKNEINHIAMKYFMEHTNEKSIVAVAGGYAMEGLVSTIPYMNKKMAKMIVPARGGIGNQVELQSSTIAVELAKKLKAEYRLLQLPDNLSETALEEMQKQPEIKETMEAINKVRILILGVGNGLEMAEKRRLDEHIKKYLKENNVIAETCGHYFDENGQVIYKINSVSIEFKNLCNMEEIILVAGGRKKAKSIMAISKKIPQGVFIIDESIADEIFRLYKK